MTALGTSFIVLGVAFLFRGLIFMLSKPFGRKPVQPSARQESFKESQERTAYYLQQIREERGELSAMNHRPLWISNFTEPSSRIFNRSDWQDSSFVTLARLMISKTLSGFSRSALRIFSRSLMTRDSILLLTDLPRLQPGKPHNWRHTNCLPSV
jgi:hypothetical protein